MNHIPTVALVGRPNVGKSTVFNRLVGDRISIVEDFPGVTRDRIYAQGEWLTKKFRLIDTGGIEMVDEPIMNQIRYQAEIAMEEADVIVFLVNIQEGLTMEDEEITKILHRSHKPVLLAVNKVDNPEQRQLIYDFYSLGLGEPLPVSGAHGTGFGDLLDKVIENFPNLNDSDIEDDAIRFSFIGRPNVGKSSLVNAMLNEERVIVSNIEGTTREAVDTEFVDNDGQKFIMIDTAGIRKKGKVYENTEKYSVMRSLSAIERSDVVCMVLDAETGIRDQDKHVAGYAYESGKAMVILVNKWDLIKDKEETFKTFIDDIKTSFKYLSFVPIVFVSAETKQRLDKLPELIKEVYQNSQRRIQSSLLNNLLMDAVAMNPTPTDKGRRLKIYYMTQVSVGPPTFIVFVNDEELMHFSYERYLENQLRETFYFEGTPIHLIIRKRQ